MSLKERTYSILVVSSTDSFASAFIGSLPEIRYYPVLTASSVSAAKRMLKEKSFDFVIINSPLSDDIGVRFAIDLCSSRQIAVLLLVTSKANFKTDPPSGVKLDGKFPRAFKAA